MDGADGKGKALGAELLRAPGLCRRRCCRTRAPAVQQLRGQGRDVPGKVLTHISPADSENVNFFGVITVDVEAELAKLDPAGWRPLRPATPDLSL